MDMQLPAYYNESEEWNRMLLLYNSALKEVGTKLEILNDEFKMHHQYNPIEHISSRIKSPQSIAKKIRHKGVELNVANIVKYINDVAGIRITCSFIPDIYRIADLIAKQNDVKVLKVKLHHAAKVKRLHELPHDRVYPYFPGRRRYRYQS